jgi:hypothetical protein
MMDTGSIVSESYPVDERQMERAWAKWQSEWESNVAKGNYAKFFEWTPVSAGQPKEEKEYLCTVKWGNDLTVMELQWNDGKWTDREYMYIYDVIAYAPLTEPYRRKDD